MKDQTLMLNPFLFLLFNLNFYRHWLHSSFLFLSLQHSFPFYLLLLLYSPTCVSICPLHSYSISLYPFLSFLFLRFLPSHSFPTTFSSISFIIYFLTFSRIVSFCLSYLLSLFLFFHFIFLHFTSLLMLSTFPLHTHTHTFFYLSFPL